jgi:hypothetical protein
MANSISGSRGVVFSGQKTVSTAGTAEALATSGIYGKIVLIALPGNTGQTYVGGADVASSTNGGLAPGASLIIDPARGHIIDLTDLYIDVDTSGDGADIYATY